MNFSWLTPAAPAAIAIVRASALPALIDRPLPDIGGARHAQLLAADRSPVDEVVVARLTSDTIELMCHGGLGMRAAVEACLIAHGLVARQPEPDQRWAALAQAPSPAAATWLLRHGARQPPFNPDFLHRNPVVLIVGATNAGKSTLINAWCGRDRALVSELPGTTRDLVTAETLVVGWRLTLIDSAGERATADALEAAGQDLARQARQRADLVLRLQPADQPGRSHATDELVVLGKADLAPAIPPGALAWSACGFADHAPAQLLAGLGEAVLGALRLPASLPHRPPPYTTIPTEGGS